MSTHLHTYACPDDLWNQAVESTPTVQIAVANLPGAAGFDPERDFVGAVAEARAAGITTIGYAYTDWGQRPLRDIGRDIDRYASVYGVDGILLDELSAERERLPYYRRLDDYIQSFDDMITVLNVGHFPDEAYMEVGDILLVFEPGADPGVPMCVPDWVHRYDEYRFGYAVGRAERWTHIDSSLSIADVMSATRDPSADELALPRRRQRGAAWEHVDAEDSRVRPAIAA